MVSKKVLSASACAFGFAAAMIVSIAASPVRADVVVDWTFDNTLADASGNDNDGTLIGGGSASYVTMAGANGISLTGINIASGQGVINTAANNRRLSSAVSADGSQAMTSASPQSQERRRGSTCTTRSLFHLMAPNSRNRRCRRP